MQKYMWFSLSRVRKCFSVQQEAHWYVRQLTHKKSAPSRPHSSHTRGSHNGRETAGARARQIAPRARHILPPTAVPLTGAMYSRCGRPSPLLSSFASRRAPPLWISW